MLNTRAILLNGYELKQPGLDANAKDLLQESIRRGEPIRYVGDQAKTNITGEFPSLLNGCMVMIESFVERQFALSLEFDPRVLVYVEQPFRLGQYVPDFLVFYRDGTIRLWSIKNLSWLKKKIEDPKEREWVIGPDGQYRHEPLWERAEKFGFPISVWFPERNPILELNIELLYCAMLHKRSTETFAGLIHKPHEICPRIVRKISRQPQPISSLFTKRNNHALRDALIAVGKNELRSNIKQQLLIDQMHAFIGLPDTKDEIFSPPESSYFAHAFLDHNAPPSQPDVLPKDGLNRLRRLEAGAVSKSTKHVWRTKVRIAKKKGIHPAFALSCRNDLKGNSRSKIDRKVLKFLTNFIKDIKKESEIPSSGGAYHKYKASQNKALPSRKAVTRQTFRSHWRKHIPIELEARKNGGRRMANSIAPSVDPNDRRLSSALPFMEASIDHWTMDTGFQYGEAKGAHSLRPFLTLLVDHATKMVLAWVVTCGCPSRRNIAILLRRCIGTWGRLPNIIFTDRGAEFFSTYLRDVCAQYFISHLFRPPENGRYGSEVERTNEAIRMQWSSRNIGKFTKWDGTRNVSKTHRASARRKMDLPTFIIRFHAFMEDYNNGIIGKSHTSPMRKCIDGIENWPFVGIQIQYDETFRLSTAVDNSEKLLISKQGIKYNQMHYQSAHLHEHIGSMVSIRFDPDDPYRIYVNIAGKWVSALSHNRVTQLSCSFAEGISRNIWHFDCESVAEEIKSHSKGKSEIRQDEISQEANIILPMKFQSKDGFSIKEDRPHRRVVQKTGYNPYS